MSQLGIEKRSTEAEERARLKAKLHNARKDYICGEESLADVSTRHQLSQGIVKKISKAEDWDRHREERQVRIAQLWMNRDVELVRANQHRFIGQVGNVLEKLDKLINHHADRLLTEAENGESTPAAQVMDLQKLTKAYQVFVEVGRKNLGMDSTPLLPEVSASIIDVEPIG